MNDLYIQFFTIATLHLFAVMSPGPDFTIILKQSVSHGRKISIITSLGIGTGILIHILICMLGLGIIISESKFLFEFIKILGSIYLLYIGTKFLIQNVQFKTNLQSY